MNQVLILGFLARFILTPIIAFSGKNFFYLVLILILLDIIDCNPLIIKMFPQKEIKKQKYCSKDILYSKIDKALDLYQYLYGIILFKPLISFKNYNILILFLLYRLLGVMLYIKNNNPLDFVFFPDMIKEYIVLLGLFGDKIPVPILVMVFIGKIGFEYLMHKRNIMIHLYKIFFN